MSLPVFIVSSSEVEGYPCASIIGNGVVAVELIALLHKDVTVEEKEQKQLVFALRV